MRQSLLIVFVSIFLISSSTKAQTLTLRQIGKNNLLMSISSYFNWRGALYSIDNLGVIHRTDLDSGGHVTIGKATYKKVKAFFGLNSKLYVVDTDGSMSEIDPVTGDWKTVSTMGEWSTIEKAFVVGNSLYSIENGAFYYHRSPNPKNRVQRGGSEFFNPGTLIRSDMRLHSLFSNGSFYEINTANGEWKTIGKSKSWRNAIATAVLADKFYSVDGAGVLLATSLSDKTEKILDTTQFAKTKILFAEAGKLYVIMTDGNLYEVTVGG